MWKSIARVCAQVKRVISSQYSEAGHQTRARRRPATLPPAGIAGRLAVVEEQRSILWMVNGGVRILEVAV